MAKNWKDTLIPGANQVARIPQRESGGSEWAVALRRRWPGFTAAARKVIFYHPIPPFCLPLEKAGDTFYFHIPQSFPNLKSLDLVNQEEAGPPLYTGNNNGNPLAVLAAALLFGIADEALKQQGGKIDAPERDTRQNDERVLPRPPRPVKPNACSSARSGSNPQQ